MDESSSSEQERIQLNFRVTKAMYKRFVIKCVEIERTKQDVLEEFVEKFLGGEPESGEKPEKPASPRRRLRDEEKVGGTGEGIGEGIDRLHPMGPNGNRL